MNRRLAIIHTTPVTIAPLRDLAQQALPGWDVVNFVDDSILPQLARHHGDVRVVESRVLQYAHFAQEVGADLLLEACSSVGELVPRMRRELDIPVVRIDEAMAEEAVRRGRRIGVAATVRTTLEPTARLLLQQADAMGKTIELRPVLVEQAYQRLAAGDQQGHDELLRSALADLAAWADVVVLAQASMARVVAALPEDLRQKYLSSPGLAMARVKAEAARLDGGGV